MNSFYHVSRLDIKHLHRFELTAIDSVETSLSCENCYSKENFRDTLLGLYANGISNHGRQYLYNYNNCVKGSNGIDYIPYMPMIENTFELVRQMKFPKRKSRFECVFACRTLEDAQKIKTTTFKGDGTIYRVECENYFVADMALVRLGASIAGGIFLAEKYWAGEASISPIWEVLMEPPVNIIEQIFSV